MPEPTARSRSRVVLLATALLLAVFGLLPMANLLTGGEALRWWGSAVRDWLLYGGMTVLAALALAHLGGEEGASWWARVKGAVMAPKPAVFAAAVALLAFGLAVAAAIYAFNRQPHSLDEMVALWHAQIIASGHFSLAPDAHREFFSMMDVIDWGRWYGVLPVGGPALLAAGLAAGAAWLVNPVCGAIGVAASYRFVRLAYDDATARATALLMAVSPFFVFMAAGYQIHTPALAALALALAALPSWRDAANDGARMRSAVAIGLALGVLVAIRPLDGALSALVIGGFQLVHAARRGGRGRWLSVAVQGLAGAMPVALLLFANVKSTGHPLLFGYNVLWGPHNFGFGTTPFGDAHTPVRALVLLSENLMRLDVYLFEWSVPAVLLAGLTLLLIRAASDWDLLAAGLIAAFLAGYALYWHDGFWVGPRFLYPTIPLWVLLIARLPALVAERAQHHAVRRGAYLFLPLCVIGSMVWPSTITGARLRAQEYRASAWQLRVDIGAQERAAGLKNALVIVHEGLGARLMVRMWALGVPRAEAERILPESDACALEMALLWEESPPLADSAGRPARLRAATPPEARPLLRPRPDLTYDETLRFADGGPFTAQCREELVADTAGTSLYPPFLARNQVGADGKLGGEIIYARDLGAHNLALRKEYGDRTWYRYVARRFAGDTSPVFVRYR